MNHAVQIQLCVWLMAGISVAAGKEWINPRPSPNQGLALSARSCLASQYPNLVLALWVSLLSQLYFIFIFILQTFNFTFFWRAKGKVGRKSKMQTTDHNQSETIQDSLYFIFKGTEFIGAAFILMPVKIEFTTSFITN